MKRSSGDLEARLAKVELERDAASARQAIHQALQRRLSTIANHITEQPLELDSTLTDIAEAARTFTGADRARVWSLEDEHLIAGASAAGAGFEVVRSPARFSVSADGPAPVAYAVRNRAAFAALAANAIQTARAQNALAVRNQALASGVEREHSVATVLQAINQSAFDLDAMLTMLSDNAQRLLRSRHALIRIRQGDLLVPVGYSGDDPAFCTIMPALPSSSEAMVALQPVVVVKRRSADNDETTARMVDHFGEHTVLAIPLVSGEEAIGLISVERPGVADYSPADIALLCIFADQAVIAIQNAQLFEALAARNEEISEALRHEEASSAILKQISESPEALRETLEQITAAALHFTGWTSAIGLVESSQAMLHTISATEVDQLAYESLPDWPVRQVLPRHDPSNQGLVKKWLRTTVLEPFIASFDSQWALKDAIAIENARLIRELRESKRSISENLDTRRVMGEVLSIVASAPTDLNETMPKITEAAMTLSEAHSAGISWFEGNQAFIYVMSAEGTVVSDGIQMMPEGPTIGIGTEARLTEQMVEFTGSIDEYLGKWPFYSKIVSQLEAIEISTIATPMFGPQGAIGAIVSNRHEAADFSERSKSLLGALASQAVVAVENARLFKQLRLKTEELEIASRHKSEFLANMSHELRTPLNAIIGYAELLQEECEDLQQPEFLPDLGKIQSAGKHLLTLISGILDLSKVEAGCMTMFLEDFDIATLVRDADAIVRPLVETNRNTFVIDCPDDLGPIHADLVKVRQVLFNLLSNSAKFTEGGTIKLTVRKPVAEATVTFTIRDTGIGMTEEQLGRLFEAFSQANAETSRRYGGTSLGLALSREFCRMMGGDIAVTSEAGAGSTFTVTLPITCLEEEQSA